MKSDYGLYVRQVGECIDMILTVYVDDLLLMGTADIIPTCYKDAHRSQYVDYWKGAFDEEHQLLLRRKVWELVPRTSVSRTSRVITCR